MKNLIIIAAASSLVGCATPNSRINPGVNIVPYPAGRSAADAPNQSSGPKPPSSTTKPVDDLADAALKTVKMMAEFGGSAFKALGPKEFVAKSTEQAARSLKDPDSAKFRNLRVVSYVGGKLLCGQLNAKNSYGGYVGYKDFVASPNDSRWLSEGSKYPEIDRSANAGIYAACNK